MNIRTTKDGRVIATVNKQDFLIFEKGEQTADSLAQAVATLTGLESYAAQVLEQEAAIEAAQAALEAAKPPVAPVVPEAPVAPVSVAPVPSSDF